MRNEVRFTIFRSFCAANDFGEVRHACGASRDSGDKAGAKALAVLSPVRAKVYMQEYSSELTFHLEAREGCPQLRSDEGSPPLELLRFIATLPLKGEGADAVRGMSAALESLPQSISAMPLQNSLSLTSMGASLMLEAKTGLSQDEALAILRKALAPFGFAVRPEPYQAPQSSGSI